MKNLLEKDSFETKEEIVNTGFIDNSDNTERVVDEIALSVAKESILNGNDDVALCDEKEEEIQELQLELIEKMVEILKTDYNWIRK